MKQWLEQLYREARLAALAVLLVFCCFSATAATWYVRPMVKTSTARGTHSIQGKYELPALGIYGTQDGTSYENAFNGFKTAFISNTIASGDTLYYCGDHFLNCTSRSDFTTIGLVYFQEDITNLCIRGDYPGDPGRIFGCMAAMYWATNGWVGPDANGVFHTKEYEYEVRYQGDGAGEFRLLQDPGTNTWTGTNGACYFLTGTNYFKPFTDWGGSNHLYVTPLGYIFNFRTNAQHITFSNLTFFASPLQGSRWGDNALSEYFTAAHNISYFGCKFYWGSEINPKSGWDDWSWTDCVFQTNRFGVYSETDGCFRGADRMTFTNCLFSDTGWREFEDQDAHGIGIQSGSGHRIIGCTFTNIGGSAIEFWNSYQQMTNNWVVGNTFNRTVCYPWTQTSGSGIVVSGGATTEGLRHGFRIYNNVLSDIGNEEGGDAWGGYGISGNSPDYIEIDNNTVVTALGGISLRPTAHPVNARIVNNLLVDCDTYIRTQGGAAPTNLVVDYNLYWPTNGTVTHTHTYTFTRDANSVTNDPGFLGASDFRIWGGSLAARSGTNLSSIFTTDILGRQIWAWPMGAYQGRTRLSVATLNITGQ